MLLAVASAAPGWVVVRPVANMHSNPSADADVVSQAIYGSNVEAVERRTGWLRIRTADGYTGWTEAAALRALKDGESYGVRGRVAQVESLFANVYRESDVTKHAPITTVPYETRLEVVAEPEPAGRWIQVRLPDDRPGWVQRGDITFDPPRMDVDELIAFSKRFLGLPYTWGGTSSFGYDCSGFTQMLCRRRGVTLPRDAGPQARWEGVVPVEVKDLKPGDLVYFGRSLEKITHTGMYIGNGEFIDATVHERPVVKIDRLDDPHWSEIFVAARRLK